MRAKKCGMSVEEKHFRRLNYCGTCKTIGSLYGQKSRLLLNYDTVFLAEILTAVCEDDLQNWQKSYQSYNCLNLPKDSMPLSLQFAATANVILTEFKIADHLKDTRRRRFKFAARIFSKEFLEAEKLLKTWSFPLENVRKILDTQETREAENESLESLAFPTAETTATFFSEGVKLIGKADLQNLAREIGFAFGSLIYLLDAFEDYEKDFSKNQFNAIASAFNLKDGKISPEANRKTVSILHKLENEIISKIYKLPVAENQKSLFAARLSQNLKGKLKTNLPVLKTKKACSPKSKQTFGQRWQNASEKARNLARNYSWQMPLVFLFVFAFALVAPAQSREAKSARECFDLSFNLMTLGAGLGAVLAFPKSILMQNPEELLTKKGRKRKATEGGGDSGEGWCDSCDCCCCGCDGCDGCCDNCDCCCCDSCDCSCD